MARLLPKDRSVGRYPMPKRTRTSTVAALGLFAVVGLLAALAPSIASLNLARAHTATEAALSALTVTPGTLSPGVQQHGD